MGASRTANAAAVAALIAILTAVANTRADDESDARALFAEGAAALAEDRYEAARDALERSLALHPHASTAFNLAVARIGMGELREAVRLLRQVRDGRYGPMNAMDETLRLLDETLGRLGILEVRVEGAAEGEIEIDGERRGRVLAHGPPVAIEVDPGVRFVRVTTTHEASSVVRVHVDEGGNESITLRLAGPETTRPDPPTDPPTEGGTEIWEEPAFWIVGALGLLAAGGAVALGLVLTENQRIEDDVFGVTFTLGD